MGSELIVSYCLDYSFGLSAEPYCFSPCIPTMASDFDARNDSHLQLSMNLPELREENSYRSSNPMDNFKRDRFELLSAYLDGEVTAAERHQVEDWLEHDPTVQCLYARLLKLRQGMRTTPLPPTEIPVEQTVNSVITRLDRKPKLILAWGGAAIAAIFVGFLSELTPINSPIANQMAEFPASDPASDIVDSQALMLALDRPLVEIPKATVSPYSIQPSLYDSGSNFR